MHLAAPADRDQTLVPQQAEVVAQRRLRHAQRGAQARHARPVARGQRQQHAQASRAGQEVAEASELATISVGGGVPMGDTSAARTEPRGRHEAPGGLWGRGLRGWVGGGGGGGGDGGDGRGLRLPGTVDADDADRLAAPDGPDRAHRPLRLPGRDRRAHGRHPPPTKALLNEDVVHRTHCRAQPYETS